MFERIFSSLMRRRHVVTVFRRQSRSLAARRKPTISRKGGTAPFPVRSKRHALSRARDKVSLLFITKAQGPVAMARATSVVAAVTLKLPHARSCSCSLLVLTRLTQACCPVLSSSLRACVPPVAHAHSYLMLTHACVGLTRCSF